MAKGLTNQPCTVAVSDALWGEQFVLDLLAAGHTVTKLPPALEAVDAILSESAHFFNKEMVDYMPAVLVAARRRKKRGKKA